MCGIVGYVTGSNKISYEKFFKQALIADVLRGFDSTGVIVGDERDFGYYKSAVNAIDFLDMKKAEKLINSNAINRTAFAIGHNRAATVGHVNSMNAHPFHHGPITGVHNGTLRRYSKLDKPNEFGTDSEALYNNISRFPLAECLSNIEGAYALVWYNSEEDTVNLIRNDERPLTLAKVKDEDTVMWASEAGMIKWLAERNDIKIEKYFQPKANVLISFDINAKEVSAFSSEAIKVEDRYPAPVQNNYNYDRQAAPQGQMFNRESGAVRDLGIDYQKSYEVWGAEFEPYMPTSDHGKVICHMLEAPFIEVHMRAITREVFNNMYNNKSLKVRIQEVRCPQGDWWKAYAYGQTAVAGTLPAKKEEDFVGPGGKLLKESQIKGLVKDGCYLCQANIARMEYDYIDWIDDKPVCPACLAHHDTDTLVSNQ